jgi:hypothetical protein
MGKMHVMVLLGSGVLLAIYGLSGRRDIVTPRGPGPDMRDFV